MEGDTSLNPVGDPSSGGGSPGDGGGDQGKGAITRANVAVTAGQDRVFRLVCFFLPDTSILRNVRFQTVFLARFLQDSGRSTLSYGATLSVVLGGGEPLQSALMGIAGMLPAAVLGPFGGVVADALPKRTALFACYGIMSALCFLAALVLGTSFGVMFFVVLAVNSVGQVANPAQSSITPLVTTPQQLAAGNSMLSIAGACGSGFGMSVLAPILSVAFGTDAVLFTAGTFLALAATRIVAIPVTQTLKRIDWKESLHEGSWGEALRWLVGHWPVATIVLIGAMSDALYNILQTLSPQYVNDVLNLDPALALYVFAPAAVGGVVAVVLAVPLQNKIGERASAIAGIAVTATTIASLAAINFTTAIVNPVNPFHWLCEIFNWDIDPALQAIAFLSIFMGAGTAVTSLATQTYINRRLPFEIQGRTFALQAAIMNFIAIIPLLILGVVGNLFGMQVAMIMIPIILIGFGFSLISLTFRFAGEKPPPKGEVFKSFWGDAAERAPEAASSPGTPAASPPQA